MKAFGLANFQISVALEPLNFPGLTTGQIPFFSMNYFCGSRAVQVKAFGTRPNAPPLAQESEQNSSITAGNQAIIFTLTVCHCRQLLSLPISLCLSLSLAPSGPTVPASD